MKATALLLCAGLGLAGCAGMNYAMEHYSKVPIVHHAYAGKTWRVFDKPAEHRLMITPTIADAAAAGVIEGGTLGLSGDMAGPQGSYRQAAADFVKKKHPGCEITDGAFIIKSQYEFFYTCKGK